MECFVKKGISFYWCYIEKTDFVKVKLSDGYILRSASSKQIELIREVVEQHHDPSLIQDYENLLVHSPKGYNHSSINRQLSSKMSLLSKRFSS